jgi:very-short-patch-repair endonuclease
MGTRRDPQGEAGPMTRELFPGGSRPVGKKAKPKAGMRTHEILMGVHLKELKLDYFRECPFHDRRNWRFDFAVPSHMLALEIDGGIYTQGRHTRGVGFQEDLTKMQEAACLNWTVIRFSVQDVLTGRAKAVVARWLKRGNGVLST